MGENKGRPERPLSATSGGSWIRRQWNDDVSLNDRYRLEAACQKRIKSLFERAAIGQLQTFELAENEVARTHHSNLTK